MIHNGRITKTEKLLSNISLSLALFFSAQCLKSQPMALDIGGARVNGYASENSLIVDSDTYIYLADRNDTGRTGTRAFSFNVVNSMRKPL